MKIFFSILLLGQLLAGCALWGEERSKTFEVRDIAEENIVSFGPVRVAVNPDRKYMNLSGDIDVQIQGQSGGPSIRKFNLFVRPGLANMVLVETHRRNVFNPFQQPQDLTKDMKTIQKGRKPIDGKTWDVYIRALYDFPEQILSVVEQKSVQIKQYECGLEIGARRLIDSQHRIYVSYIKGIDDCQGLPLNDSLLSDKQRRMIRKFTNQFEANVSISDNSIK